MDNDFILVLDLGGPQAVAMARKLRKLRYYTEIISRRADIDLFRRKAPRGILIAGGESNENSGAFPQAVLTLGIPVLALGRAARMMAEAEGASFEGVLLENSASQITFQPCDLFEGLSESDRYFARIDGFALPKGFSPIATTLEGLSPAFADINRRLYGLQFYAESNDPDGAVILSNFAERICGCTPMWSLESYIDEEMRFIREKIGDGKALMAVSGGVDSAVCALLMKRAIGDRMTCVFIDNGLLRNHENERVLQMYRDELALPLIHIDARTRFLERLKGISNPLEKRQAVHEEFVATIMETRAANPDYEFFVTGTIYSDLLRTGASDGANVRTFDSGTRVEPIRMLFKDEVRTLGEALKLPPEIVNRQSLPMPALAIRCCGEVTKEKLAMLRKADNIFREEVRASGLEKRLSQYFAVLTDTQSLGTRDGGHQYEYACVLRAVSDQGMDSFGVGRLPYDLLDRVARRITDEIPGINRVAYDISDSAHSAVEWN